MVNAPFFHINISSEKYLEHIEAIKNTREKENDRDHTKIQWLMKCVQKSIRDLLKLQLACQGNAKDRWPSNDRDTPANFSSVRYCHPGSSLVDEAEANFQSNKKILETSKFKHTSPKPTIHDDLESFMHSHKNYETVPYYR